MGRCSLPRSLPASPGCIRIAELAASPRLHFGAITEYNQRPAHKTATLTAKVAAGDRREGPDMERLPEGTR